MVSSSDLNNCDKVKHNSGSQNRQGPVQFHPAEQRKSGNVIDEKHDTEIIYALNEAIKSGDGQER